MLFISCVLANIHSDTDISGKGWLKWPADIYKYIYISLELWLTRQSHLCLWIQPEFFLADPPPQRSSLHQMGGLRTWELQGPSVPVGHVRAGGIQLLRQVVRSGRPHLIRPCRQTGETWSSELQVTCSHKTHREYETQKVGKQVEINRTFQTRRKKQF